MAVTDATVKAESGWLWNACRWEGARQDRQNDYCMATQLSCCCSRLRNKRLASTSSPAAHLLVLPHAQLP